VCIFTSAVEKVHKIKILARLFVEIQLVLKLGNKMNLICKGRVYRMA
jgi:hypothetical protein